MTIMRLSRWLSSFLSSRAKTVGSHSLIERLWYGGGGANHPILESDAYLGNGVRMLWKSGLNTKKERPPMRRFTTEMSPNFWAVQLQVKDSGFALIG